MSSSADGSERRFGGCDVQDSGCPSRVVLEHITSRWGVLVLSALETRTHRFSELRRHVGGVSEKMLAQTLRALEHDGLVNRHAFAEIPPRVEYTLTQRGNAAAGLVGQLVSWVEQQTPQIVKEQQSSCGGYDSEHRSSPVR